MLAAGIVVLGFWAPPSGHSQATAQVIREIDDAATGDRWLLFKDASDPAGPGRMARVESAAVGSANRPVIHAGDALVVEEHTAVVDAQLEATALGLAAVDAEFRARLKIGGKLIRVVALGPGRARFKPETRAQR